MTTSRLALLTVLAALVWLDARGDGSVYGDGGSDGSTDWSLYGWDEPCRAYALMPREWCSDPWLPAEGFFTVGRTFPPEALSWRAGEASYDARQALMEGRLGPTVLGGVGTTPLWGGEDGAINPEWRELIRRVGVCTNETRALLASPFWERLGRKTFPALVNCDGAPDAVSGIDLYLSTDWDDERWAASGAKAEDVLPRLARLKSEGLELVCVTPELAEERRKLRRAAEAEAAAAEDRD